MRVDGLPLDKNRRREKASIKNLGKWCLGRANLPRQEEVMVLWRYRSYG